MSAVAVAAPPAPFVVLVTEALTDPALVEEVRVQAAGAPLVVVAPALSSPARYWTNDVRGRQLAAARLEATLAALHAAGLEAGGEIGDDDPLQALDDAVAVHRAGGALVVTPPASRRGWLEVGLVRAARERTGLDVRHAVVDGAGGATASDDDDRHGEARRYPTRDLLVTCLLAVLATFGSGGTFLALHWTPGWQALAWAVVFDVVPKGLFVWALWRLYLKRR
jgi:hypothetical protein